MGGEVSEPEKDLTWYQAELDACKKTIERMRNDGYTLGRWRTLVSDLDRSPHGRHEGDVESGSPTGRSEGNPFLKVGQQIGYTLDGDFIVVPEHADRHNPKAWIVPRDRNPGDALKTR